MSVTPRSVFTERRLQPRQRQANSRRRSRSRALSNRADNRRAAVAQVSQPSDRPYLKAISTVPQTQSPAPPQQAERPNYVATLKSPSLPNWLRLLMRLERGTTFMTMLLGCSVLVVYGFTFYSQQRWSQEYETLQTLQRKERRLTSAIETLKEDAARAAENPHNGLVPQNPASTIFLPAPPQGTVEEATEAPKAVAAPRKGNRRKTVSPPAGY